MSGYSQLTEAKREASRVATRAYRVKHRERIREQQRTHKRVTRGGSAQGLMADRTDAFTTELACLSAIDIGYLAGLVDGEGSVCIRRIGDKNAEHYSGYFGCDISIANTDIGMISWLTQVLPSSKVKWQNNTDTRFKSHKPIARWYVCGRRSAALAKAIEPYLHTVKKRRARLLQMMLAERPYNGRQITQEEIERRNSIFAEFTRIGG